MERPERVPEGVLRGDDGVLRCWWCGVDPLYQAYHDDEWGTPVERDRRLFEKLSLEGFQSGLSWLTILRKRENFRRAFADFDMETVARFGPADVERLLSDPGIVRNRAKIEATIGNARRYAALADEFGSLAAYVWRFEPDPATRPATLDHATLLTFTTSPEATAMSKDLRRRGWAFIGPTTAYAFMQAMGLVNDHLDGCAAGARVRAARARFRAPQARPDPAPRTPAAPRTGPASRPAAPARNSARPSH
jgi:DNA-3-methyladenine glycosylase I